MRYLPVFRDLIVAFMAVGIILTFAVKAKAQAQITPTTMLCMPTEQVLEVTETSGEQETYRGMADQILVQVWSDEEGGFSITARASAASEIMCVIAAGKYWHKVGD